MMHSAVPFRLFISDDVLYSTSTETYSASNSIELAEIS